MSHSAKPSASIQPKRCGPSRKHTENEEAIFEAEYRSGMTIKAIGIKHGTHRINVGRILTRRGVARRPPKHAAADNFFAEPLNEISAYWLGFLAADGSIGDRAKGNCTVQLRLSAVDQEHVKAFRDAVCPSARLGFYTAVSYGEKRDFCGVTIYSRCLVATLIKHGIGPRKSLTLLPWQGPRELIRHYWRGLFDGDGGFAVNQSGREKGRMRIHLCGTREICEGFASFVTDRLGIREMSPSPQGAIWQVRYHSCADVSAVARLLYDNALVSLPRKLALAKQAFDLKRKTQDWGWVTKDYLQQAYQEAGSWVGVMRALGTNYKQMILLRRRFGFPVLPPGNPNFRVSAGSCT